MKQQEEQQDLDPHLDVEVQEQHEGHQGERLPDETQYQSSLAMKKTGWYQDVRQNGDCQTVEHHEVIQGQGLHEESLDKEQQGAQTQHQNISVIEQHGEHQEENLPSFVSFNRFSVLEEELEDDTEKDAESDIINTDENMKKKLF